MSTESKPAAAAVVVSGGGKLPTATNWVGSNFKEAGASAISQKMVKEPAQV
jgi:hypothetical protein